MGGESDVGAAAFDAILVSADAADVRGVGQDTPGDILESVPLFKEIVPAMVADSFDVRAMAHANLVEVRGVDDQFAAVGENRIELVHALAGGP